MTDKFDYKEYARQMRENSVVENGIVNVSKELWYQIADIIDDNGNLINRQKSEIERLKEENNRFADIGKMYSEIRAEAIKDFAERLLSCYKDFDETNEIIYFENLTKAIQDTLKEMVGE